LITTDLLLDGEKFRFFWSGRSPLQKDCCAFVRCVLQHSANQPHLLPMIDDDQAD
jgi:hypothetical protein